MKTIHTMSTLKLGQIDEDEYFGRVLYDELVAILKNVKTEHRKGQDHFGWCNGR